MLLHSVTKIGLTPSAGKTKYQNKGKIENFKCKTILCLHPEIFL